MLDSGHAERCRVATRMGLAQSRRPKPKWGRTPSPVVRQSVHAKKVQSGKSRIGLAQRDDQSQVEADVSTHSATISPCGKGAERQLALGLLSTMANSEHAKVVQRGELAVGLLSTMTKAKVETDATTCSATIQCLREEQSGNSHWACSADGGSEMDADTICDSAAISACEKSQEWQLALGLLSTMANSDVGSGEWQLALALLSTMAKSDVGSGEWQLALALLSTMANADVGSGEWQLALALLSLAMRRWQRRVATRIGLAQLNGRWQQRVATRIGLAQLNGRGSSEWQLALGLLS